MANANKSLRQKTAARLAAIQLAYSYKQLQKAPSKVQMLSDAAAFGKSDQDPEFSAVFKEKPHAPSLNRLLDGYVADQLVLEQLAIECLKDEWKVERVNPLLLVILQFGILELDQNRELSEAVIVNEYTDLAARLLDDRDVDFIHANLKQLAEKYRGK